MFYRQCNDCNERWELGTASTCTCAIDEPVAWEQFYPEMGKPKLAYLPPTESLENACYIPPQRTWIGLTDKEIEEIWKIAMFTDYGIGAELSNQPFVHYAKAIEAKLKEKNF